ncbi:MAG: SRPBCC family protein [Thermoplasmata archaeon]|nr:SRPBCC family protein [Thermoplasmata archaeon]MCI4356425.1 SRPBCC family protein [Thermoplasmata archaeon]
MVHIVDEGGEFDAPLETVWRFIQSQDDHGESHPEHQNAQMKPLTETTVQVSWEQDMEGKKVKVVNRLTMLPPVGLAIEQLEGPLAGSKFFNYYTPKGAKTGVTIVGDFKSPSVPEAHLEPMVRKNFEHVFSQDTASLRKFTQHK